MAKLLLFPVRRPASTGASRWDIWKGRAREAFGTLLNRLGTPGAVRDTTIKDSLTGQEVQIRVGVFYTCISVNGRDFYFDRTTGKYDGAGGNV
ncbi:hypothetical protein BWI17_04565 [Betaproteobacteria bacterium GR16-43]|nr:hypothetical protein BWI17_04565 [Betaproteobacteria bacterium GR16-43]